MCVCCAAKVIESTTSTLTTRVRIETKEIAFKQHFQQHVINRQKTKKNWQLIRRSSHLNSLQTSKTF
jgi:hypothetical protein